MHLILRSVGLTTVFTVLFSVELSFGNLRPLQNSTTLGQTISANRYQAEAEYFLQQGIQKYETRQFQTALKFLEKALVIYKRIHVRHKEAEVLNYLGKINDELKQFTKAIEYHQLALIIARENNNREMESIALADLISTHFQARKPIIAAEYMSQLVKLDLSKVDVDYAIVAEVSARFQQFFYFDEHFSQQFKATRYSIDEGSILYYLGKYDKAIEAFRKDMMLHSQNLGEGTILEKIGLSYFFLGKYEKAIQYLQKSLKYYHKSQSSSNVTSKRNVLENQINSLNNLGYVLFRVGKLVEAEQKLRLATQLVEFLKVSDTQENNIQSEMNGQREQFEQSQLHIMDTLPHRHLQQTLIAQNKTIDALEVAERGRARALVRLISSHLPPSVSIPQEFSKTPSLETIQLLARKQNSTLIYYSLIFEDKRRTFYDYKNEIMNREMFMRGSFPYHSKLYIWVIQPSGKILFRSVDLKAQWKDKNISAFGELVRANRESIGARSRARIALQQNPQNISQSNRNLQKIYQLLIEPIADLLPTKSESRIIFFPQESLYFVPFAALQDADGKSLIEKYAISTAPSIQVLSLTQKRRQELKKYNHPLAALVVGNPKMPKVRFSQKDPYQTLLPLPGAEVEAQAIARMLKVNSITGSQATKAMVLPQMSKARIIHLATHGLFDSLEPIEFSNRFQIPGMLALSPSEKDDGLLTANEIFKLKLTAELAVLSACDTGLGILSEEGVIGLSRSLIAAGVPSVVVSLWKVPDEPTALLMKEFYRNLQQNPNKAQALRQAMLATKQEYPAPLNWAAFTLIGEAE
jgi:CHAT domain-containing protein